MGMRVGGSSVNWSSQQTSSSVNGWQKSQQGMKDLFSSLQSGDLASAQKAFASVQTNTSSSNSPLTKVGDALQAGDLAGAQQAAKAMHAARGGHHHAKAATQASNSTSSTTTGTTAEASSNSALTNNLQSSFANLMGSMGGNGSTANVTNFLQSLDDKLKSMDAASAVNITA